MSANPKLDHVLQINKSLSLSLYCHCRKKKERDSKEGFVVHLLKKKRRFGEHERETRPQLTNVQYTNSHRQSYTPSSHKEKFNQCAYLVMETAYSYGVPDFQQLVEACFSSSLFAMEEWGEVPCHSVREGILGPQTSCYSRPITR